jgi:hypothetical protein
MWAASASRPPVFGTLESSMFVTKMMYLGISSRRLPSSAQSSSSLSIIRRSHAAFSVGFDAGSARYLAWITQYPSQLLPWSRTVLGASRHECGSIEGSRAAVPSSGRRCSIGFERSATSRARMCVPRSLPTSSPRRRGQRGARAAQRARTTLTLTSGDARSAARKALAGQHAQRRAIGAQPNCLDPLKNRRKTGTNHSPAAAAQNLCLRRRNPSSNPFGDPHSCRKTRFWTN